MKLFFCALLTMSNLYAGTGSHGGDGYVENSKMRFRDLVDPRNCEMRSGRSILKQEQKVTEILDLISERGNPYFANKIKEQIIKSQWCFTNQLKRINTLDSENELITFYVNPSNKVQIAARLEDEVYVDNNALNDLTATSPEDRPYVFIHEAMHGLIPDDVRARNMKVGSTVLTIEKLVQGKANIDDLDSAIIFGHINVANSQSFIQFIESAKNHFALGNKAAAMSALKQVVFDNRWDFFKKQKNEIDQFLSKQDLLDLYNKSFQARWKTLAEFGIRFININYEDHVSVEYPMGENYQYQLGACIAISSINPHFWSDIEFKVSLSRDGRAVANYLKSYYDESQLRNSVYNMSRHGAYLSHSLQSFLDPKSLMGVLLFTTKCDL